MDIVVSATFKAVAVVVHDAFGGVGPAEAFRVIAVEIQLGVQRYRGRGSHKFIRNKAVFFHLQHVAYQFNTGQLDLQVLDGVLRAGRVGVAGHHHRPGIVFQGLGYRGGLAVYGGIYIGCLAVGVAEFIAVFGLHPDLHLVDVSRNKGVARFQEMVGGLIQPVYSVELGALGADGDRSVGSLSCGGRIHIGDGDTADGGGSQSSYRQKSDQQAEQNADG